MDELSDKSRPALKNMRLEDIARHCEEETQKYFQQGENVTDYCFDLLRLALQLEVPDAFTHVYRTYQSLVRRWVYNHPQFHGTGEAADYFVSAAFTNFYFAARGDKFKRFDSLGQLLTYLKRCVHTAIAQHFRGTEPPDTVPLESGDNTPTKGAESVSNLADIWERIDELLPDETDRLLAHFVFSQNLKPSQIIELHPHWQSAREISVQLQRIRRNLRQDRTLRLLVGIEDDDDS